MHGLWTPRIHIITLITLDLPILWKLHTSVWNFFFAMILAGKSSPMTVQKMIRSFGCHLNLASSLVNLWFFLISPKILQVRKTPLLCWFSICYHQQNTPSPSRKKTQFDNQKHHLESPTKTPSISWKASHFLSITVALNDTRLTKKQLSIWRCFNKTWCQNM